MNRLPAQTGSNIHVTLHSRQRATEVRIQVSWRGRLPVRAAVRLLIALALVLAATAIATAGQDELARGALYTLAGFVTAARPKIRS